MDPAFIRDDLFRPFRSTKASGYGLGAYQARELVAVMGGTLDVQSDPTRGTHMTIALGLGEMPAAARGSAA
jgi:signal transduction histidine kinase